VILNVRQQAVVHSKKLKFIAYALCAMFFALCSAVGAQQQTDLKKIGWLGSVPLRPTRRGNYSVESSVLGYVEGKNIIFEYRSAER
jgi:hypothetical protein